HPPRRAAVVAAVQPARLARRLDERVHTTRYGARNVDADLADKPGRQTVRQLRPVVAAVRRLPQPALFGAADDRPRLALAAPRGRIDLIRIRGVHREIDEAGRIGDEQDLLPRAAAILRAVNAAIGIGTRRRAQRRDIHEIGILRVRLDRADLA